MSWRIVVSLSATLAALYACGETLAASNDTPDAADAADSASPDVRGPGDDEGRDDDSSVVVGCDRDSPFGAAVDVPVSGQYSVEAARFNDGRTAAYLALCPADGNKTACDLFQSPYVNGAFATHTPLTSVSSPLYDSYPTVTANGQLLVFGSTRNGGVKIFVASAVNASFANAIANEQRFAPGLANTNEPYVLGSGAALYFGGSTGTTNWEIYRATAWGTDASAPTERIVELSSPQNDQAPVVAEDEREIFFASERAMDGTGLDIHRALKSAADAPFGQPERLVALSKNGNDWPVWISPDRCDLYFINKDPASNVATLRVASRR